MVVRAGVIVVLQNDPSVSQLVYTITEKAPTRVVAAFNQEKALVGAFSVIVQLHRLIDLRHY